MESIVRAACRRSSARKTRLQQLRVAVLGGLVFGTFSDATPDLEPGLAVDVTRGLLRVMNRTPHVLGRNTR